MSVPTYTQVKNSIKFSSLDATDGSFPIYTIGWRIRDQPDDWSNRFLDYKYERSKRAFHAGSWMLKEAVSNAMQDLEFSPQSTVLINALGSADIAANNSAILYRTTKWIAEGVGASFSTDMLSKQAHRPLKNQGGAADRDAEVANKYTCPALPKNISNVVIVDDLVTRGATFAEIKRSISLSSPGLNYCAVALGKNENQRHADYYGITLNNDHVTDRIVKLWAEAEKRFS